MSKQHKVSNNYYKKKFTRNCRGRNFPFYGVHKQQEKLKSPKHTAAPFAKSAK